MFAPWAHCVDAVPAQGGPPASVRIGLAPWAGHSLGSALLSPPATCCTQTPAQTAAAAQHAAEQEVRPASNRSRLRGARRDNVIL